ncbi:hypothetical protein [Desulforamulus ruminis]|nr:hypothetical protein [Desulforamulus ruminis]
MIIIIDIIVIDEVMLVNPYWFMISSGHDIFPFMLFDPASFIL